MDVFCFRGCLRVSEWCKIECLRASPSEVCVCVCVGGEVPWGILSSLFVASVVDMFSCCVIQNTCSMHMVWMCSMDLSSFECTLYCAYWYYSKGDYPFPCPYPILWNSKKKSITNLKGANFKSQGTSMIVPMHIGIFVWCIFIKMLFLIMCCNALPMPMPVHIPISIPMPGRIGIDWLTNFS